MSVGAFLGLYTAFLVSNVGHGCVEVDHSTSVRKSKTVTNCGFDKFQNEPCRVISVLVAQTSRSVVELCISCLNKPIVFLYFSSCF